MKDRTPMGPTEPYEEFDTSQRLRDRIEELEAVIEALRAELRIAQQELWSSKG